MSARSQSLARRLSPSSILVVGDVILDEYLIGRATRLSREAAVPVLERTRRHLLLGGAANPALGVARLNGRPTMAGVVGADQSATEIWRLLAEAGIAAGAVVTDYSRPTTLKTRIVAEGTLTYLQHLARIDMLDRSPLSDMVVDALVERIHACLPAQQVALLSHYGNGVLSEAVVAAVRRAAGGNTPPVPLLVDAQSDFGRFAGFDLVRCNRHEAGSALAMELPRAGSRGGRAGVRRYCVCATGLRPGPSSSRWAAKESPGSTRPATGRKPP
ncbi:MAG: PfkB family carbohydrate kinase [Ardenticatenaceae bacterium]|nr:PfkB family carbohydrate kinase [Ardenticatenaceae bacterium]